MNEQVYNNVNDDTAQVNIQPLEVSVGESLPLDILNGGKVPSKLSDKDILAIDPKAGIEALLFVNERPLTVEQIKAVMEGLGPDEIKQILFELKAEYAQPSKGIKIEEIAGGFQFVSSSAVSPALKKFYRQRDAKSLSGPALETLAIIAYKQPLTRLDIESLRGVKVDGVIKTLLEKNLIRITGRKDIIGRPFVYGTTRQFLEYFGLRFLEDLPKIEEFSKNETAISRILALSNKQKMGELSEVKEV